MQSARSSQKAEPDRSDSPQEGEQYFFELLERYQDPIFRFVYFRVNNRAVALDITQDTFTNVWSYLARGKTIDHEEAFLYRAAKNAVIDHFKKAKPFSLDSMVEGGFDPRTDRTVDDIAKSDDIATIKSIIKDLDEESQQIIYLRFAEEKSIEEIAALFGKKTNAMTVQIHRIIKKLRRSFTDHTFYEN
ncbi:sigma-70 family RNA polymerase sigma factor [Candidatus Nomurabacteria bacterium]|nr:sigma-70 family RNA polymerase sigma factor [Candidatus Nomurabacteria bacterium]